MSFSIEQTFATLIFWFKFYWKLSGATCDFSF